MNKKLEIYRSEGSAAMKQELLPPSCGLILESIMRLRLRSKTATIRAIAEDVGLSNTRIHQIVIHLRNAGLISFNDHQAGTIMPRVRFIPAKDLP